MDEASQLVSELQTRLKELDHKVWLYRRDMTSEYTKYAEELLRDVPADVSDKVQQAIAASMKSYRSLNPEPYDNAIESCAVGVGNDNAANGLHKNAPIPFRPSTPDSPFGTTEDENEIPRSPHEREKEFTGLFTPSFLPLLDSSHQRRLSTDKQASPSLDKGKGREFGSMGVDASTQSSRSLTATPDLSRPTPPATPKRRNTDEASVKSDSSDGPIRRSALRRSSSSSRIQSPRHVRFQFEGKEVLPTASPSTESVLPQDTSSSIFGNDDDSDEEGGAEQVEDIDDPPPKRISSSQALRALSRGPLEDDGTKWIEVSGKSDSPTPSPSTNGSSRESSSENIKLTNGGGLRIITPEETTSMSTNGNGIPESNTQDDTPNDGADDSSEDEMLAIGSRKSKKPIPTPTVDSNKETKLEQESKSIDAEPLPEKHLAEPVKHDVKQEKKESEGGLKFDEDYDDVLFQFDEHANEEGPRPPPEEEQESDSESDATATEEPAINLSAYSQSPARPIPWPKESTPTSPSRSSYRGHPFSESIVKDEDLHAKMASLGDMQSFVGSVNGRSGFDESNALSFRESLKYGSGGNFSGTPRSMSERMMLDDLMEAEEARAR